MLRTWIGLLGVALVLGVGPASAQDYPNRPVRLIVPVAPGVRSISSRAPWGKRMSESLGQPMVVENRAGDAIVGTESAAKSTRTATRWCWRATSHGRSTTR